MYLLQCDTLIYFVVIYIYIYIYNKYKYIYIFGSSLQCSCGRNWWAHIVVVLGGHLSTIRLGMDPLDIPGSWTALLDIG
jgi:hypothetical protein